MKSKTAKNIAIFMEDFAQLVKMQALIYQVYFVLIGVLYLCGVCKDTVFGHIIWGLNDDWALSLKNFTAGNLSAVFQLNMLVLICIINIIISGLKYLNTRFTWRHYRWYRFSYDKKCFATEIIASIVTMMIVCALRGRISVDVMIETFLGAIILKWLASLLLKITGTEKAIIRIGNCRLYTTDVSGNAYMKDDDK